MQACARNAEYAADSPARLPHTKAPQERVTVDPWPQLRLLQAPAVGALGGRCGAELQREGGHDSRPAAVASTDSMAASLRSSFIPWRAWSSLTISRNRVSVSG